jgi:hypothetical protein
MGIEGIQVVVCGSGWVEYAARDEIAVEPLQHAGYWDPAAQVYQRSNTLYRHQQLIQEWLEIEPVSV